MCQVDRCEASSPRLPLPWGPGTHEGDHGAVYPSAFAGYQLKSCVSNDYPAVIAQCRDLVRHTWAAQLTAPHRPIEAVPMHPTKHGRDDDIEIAAKRLVRRITHDLGDCVTPLIDYALAIHGHGGGLILTRRFGSVHTLTTVCSSGQFTANHLYVVELCKHQWNSRCA